MLFNRLSLLSFALALISVMVMLFNVGFLNSIPKVYARYAFLGFGALGFLFSFLSTKFDKQRNKEKGYESSYNYLFYAGAGLLTIGVLFKLMHWPFAAYIIITGVLVAAASYFVSPKEQGKPKDDSLLDN